MKIEFTSVIEMENSIFHPFPASSVVPDWYRKMPMHVGGNEKSFVDGFPNSTIKRCVPVADAMGAGYIIPTYQDVVVSDQIQQDGSSLPYFSWRGNNENFAVIDFHQVSQAPIHPMANGNPFPKWNNPWAIKTPPGYSVIFCNPMHRDNGIFTIFPGIVDTDSYSAPVNFPFQLNNPDFRGIIPAGTPICQIIPFKRDEWDMVMENNNPEKSKHITSGLVRLIWNSYKRQYWSRKEFR